MRLDVAVCLPKESETVSLIRGVTDALRAFRVTEDCVDDIRLALSEACTNVIDHAAIGDEYEVRVQIGDERCAISVTNSGDSFDAVALVDEMPDALSARGRGVGIMRASWTTSRSPPSHRAAPSCTSRRSSWSVPTPRSPDYAATAPDECRANSKRACGHRRGDRPGER